LTYRLWPRPVSFGFPPLWCWPSASIAAWRSAPLRPRAKSRRRGPWGRRVASGPSQRWRGGWKYDHPLVRVGDRPVHVQEEHVRGMAPGVVAVEEGAEDCAPNANANCACHGCVSSDHEQARGTHRHATRLSRRAASTRLSQLTHTAAREMTCPTCITMLSSSCVAPSQPNRSLRFARRGPVRLGSVDV